MPALHFALPTPKLVAEPSCHLMKEAAFIKQNREQWSQFESMLSQQGRIDPDRLSDLFVRVTDDLSYARTYYPNSRTVDYLNALAATIHLSIYRNKKEDKGRFRRFWTHDLPLLSYRQRWQLLYSLLFFAVFAIIGAVSTEHDPEFARLILGDDYVNMTLENIKEGKPMGVYDSANELLMFLKITTNNVRVAFLAFAAGALASVGTVLLLLYNGIMVGAFQYFFHESGLLAHSASTIWIHGTLEISAIVVAGAAGLVMGNSLLFPGTYPRWHSFKHGAREGVKLVVSLVPVFVGAGFLESFVTRYEFMPLAIKLGIIVLSAAYMVFYYVLLPRRRAAEMA
jgi:uncharacterized membrane protein SpoIIM required for sporulation